MTLVAPLSGCFGLKVRQLRTENQMKEARILQLEQDMTALRDENSKLQQQVSTSDGKANAARMALTETTDSRTREMTKNLTTSIESEAKLKADKEQLEAKALALETQLADARASMQQVQKQLDAKSEELVEARKDLLEVQAASEASTRKTTELSTQLESKSKEATVSTEQVAQLTSQLRQKTDELAAAQAKFVASGKADAETVAKAEEAAKSRLASLITASKVSVAGSDGAVRITILSDDLFQVGKVEFSEEGKASLASVAEALKSLAAKRIVVAGHTDDTPVKNMSYADNWEVASARANEVVRWLVANSVSSPEKIVSESHAFYAPTSAGKDAAGKKQNRRVEIIVEL
ncbi:OmpA family protein [Candidatus Sumerlaeota bacterium]|nr:OmpA family protein [Candidatus Sumerlaeota bacterium]